ncbi:MAG TPA: universal stress protein [Nitrosomonas sp.]|nr:universal stress protein [Nitrosomonas sp.]HMW20300.1 universal stress protein [Nitrosomonas sp.]HMW68492.1 universal stress protein [Nitrosomonas sp.]HMY60509.1 universal stress protein [Nitrosomonas sp.]HMY90276.1 universal stress protein [Nitrosomonas sp.]
MFKRIYVAIDQSEFSKQALIAATKIAQTFKASLCLGHCITDDTQSNQESALKFLEDTKSQITDIGDIEVKISVADGQYGLNGISTAIAQSANDWQSDLLVVGTSNRKGLDRFFLGSVAEELVSKINCSVMLFRIN